MTGEMYHADPAEWPVHAAIAAALGGSLEPFDQYQGPYVLIGPDARVGQQPYALCLPGPVRLWLVSEDGGFGHVWREDTRTQSEDFPLYAPFTEELAVEAARELVEHAR